MAAVAVGTSIWLPAILFGHGLLLALTPTVAQSHCGLSHLSKDDRNRKGKQLTRFC
jgi:Na+-driven multidrug efflux pump